MMKSDLRLKSKTFATFRVSGDALLPDMITKTLKFQPTLSYRRGDQYSTAGSGTQFVGKTGVWFLSTERIVASDKLADHLAFIFFVLGLTSNQRRFTMSEPAFVSNLNSQLRTVMDLQRLMKQAALKASLTCFWHGPVGAKPPTMPSTRLLEMASIEIETDFDVDTDAEEDATLVA